MAGLFLETGPYRMRNSSSIEFNEFTWALEADMLFGTFWPHLFRL